VSLLVWNSDSDDLGYNPGKMGPHTGAVIDRALDAAVEAVPEGSEAKERLEESYDSFQRSTGAMYRPDYKLGEMSRWCQFD
jgi:hypothetical protein